MERPRIRLRQGYGVTGFADFTDTTQTRVELTDAASRRCAWLMSVEELKKTVATLSPGGTERANGFPFSSRHRGDVAYQVKLKARVDDKDPSRVDAGRVRKALRRRISAGGAFASRCPRNTRRKQNRFSVSEIFALFRVICGQKKSGAAAPHSKTSVRSVSSVVKLLWRERGDDFFEGRLAAQRVPPWHQF